MRQTLFIGAADIDVIVREIGLDSMMDELMAELDRALATFEPSLAQSRARDGFSYMAPAEGLIEWMPHYERGGSVTIKVVGYHPSNPTYHGVPSIISTVSTYDSNTGHLTGVADGTFLTALRTGAVSALATQLLAIPEPHIFGLIGCGAQAVSQIHAMSRRFDVTTLLINDKSKERIESLPERIADFFPGSIEIIEVPVDQAMAESDVLCTSTSMAIGGGPLFKDQECKPWLHVNAVGSDFPGKFELPVEFLRRSLVCPDFLPQAIREGECQQLSLEEIGPTLAELVSSPELAGESRWRTTVFDSTGWALTDHVAMRLLMRYAVELDAHTPMTLETVSGDPYTPYEWDQHGPVSAVSIDAIET